MNKIKIFLFLFCKQRYTIKIRHGSSIEWIIKKRYKHFHDLHKALVKYIETETERSISSLNK